MNIHHERIQERAYALWVEDGRIHGRDNDYWFRAERELNYAGKAAPMVAGDSPVTTKKAPGRKRAAGKRAA
ncbi:MAG: DUF2934 domain-containing protein [Microvirga sp.]|jgi:DUF2934 family protein